MARLLFIVSRAHGERYEHLKRTFADEEKIEVVLDRRRGERRWHDVDHEAERRAGDRRRRDLEEDLRTMGWVLVRQPL